MNDDWLAALKVGDEVLATQTFGRGYNRLIVSGITATMIKAKHPDEQTSQSEYRFRKNSGRSVGTSAWDTNYLCEPTEEKRKIVRLAILKETIRRLKETLVVPKDEEGMNLMIFDLRKYQSPVAK